jgi:hypothetical protein
VVPPVNRNYSTALDRYSRRGEHRQIADDGRRRGHHTEKP